MAMIEIKDLNFVPDARDVQVGVLDLSATSEIRGGLISVPTMNKLLEEDTSTIFAQYPNLLSFLR
jgi:hypothetical protein